MKSMRLSIALALLILGFDARADAQRQSPAADPLTVTIHVEDAQRFAQLWKRTDGHPTAAALNSAYIARGSEGLKIFTPNRIIDGTNLARQIAAHRDWYQQAIDRCLPWIAENNAQLRSIYLGLHGLLPERPLPQIYVVVGGANSGGTAGPGAQVLGLEVLCQQGPTRERFAEVLRTFFAHETAHTFQPADPPAMKSEPLLSQILMEGAADYVASLVTGTSPSPARDAYGTAHEAEIWSQFVKDRAIAHSNFDADKGFTSAGNRAFAHWLYNGASGKLPGWETDMGYWLGMQIAKRFVERSADPHAALRELLALRDPARILSESGYAERFTA